MRLGSVVAGWAVAAPIQPLAWELPHAVGVALKRQGKKKKERKRSASSAAHEVSRQDRPAFPPLPTCSPAPQNHTSLGCVPGEQNDSRVQM